MIEIVTWSQRLFGDAWTSSWANYSLFLLGNHVKHPVLLVPNYEQCVVL